MERKSVEVEVEVDVVIEVCVEMEVDVEVYTGRLYVEKSEYIYVYRFEWLNSKKASDTYIE